MENHCNATQTKKKKEIKPTLKKFLTINIVLLSFLNEGKYNHSEISCFDDFEGSTRKDIKCIQNNAKYDNNFLKSILINFAVYT